MGLRGGDRRPCGHMEREKKKKNRFAEANREREKEGDRFCKEEEWGYFVFHMQSLWDQLMHATCIILKKKKKKKKLKNSFRHSVKMN